MYVNSFNELGQLLSLVYELGNWGSEKVTNLTQSDTSGKW